MREDARNGGTRRAPSLLARVGVVLVLSVALLSCATAPETGRRQLLLVSPNEETGLGVQAFQQIKQQQPVVTRGRDVAMLQRVGDRISKVVSLPNARWEFVLFKEDAPNAFALPGGKVGVNTGILPITQDEAGLATVIGHEIAHAVARHGAERMSHGMLVELGGAGLSAALGSEPGANRDLIMQAYGVGSQLGVMLPYSRTQELEADELGLLYMARAGYDPRAAIGFWQRFVAYNAQRGGAPPEFLSTHPLDQRRIAELERSLPQAVAEYERARAR
ncbi:peptidase M48 family protein [Halochromatium salexigens]|uniref:Peptidase M48 family protein n=2 Tax=Halochromatium salexigens TaxID=49447 RepID=A0AAJ0UIN1_HALSE|nr:peptidase M48 family protein [Halochromatium salexigens]